jgi:hypothetical protein
VRQLEGKRGKDKVEVAAVLEIARTKKGRSQEPVSEDPLADCLGDRGLASPGEPVQPEDGRFIEVFCPRLDLVKDSLPRTPQTAFAISVFISGPRSAAAAVQYRQVGCRAHE